MTSRLLFDIIEDTEDCTIAGVAQCLYYFSNEPIYDFQLMNRLAFTSCGTEYSKEAEEDIFDYFKDVLSLLVRRGVVTPIPETESLCKYKLSDTGLAAVKTYCRIL